MSIRGMLRAAVFLLLIRTWLAEGDDPSVPPTVAPTVPPTLNLDLVSSVPKLVLNLFDCKNCANETVVHNILERVLSNYDDRLRPNFGGGPVPVGISMYVSRIEKVSEKNMDYTISMFFHQTWKDPRLAYHETNQNLTLDYRLLEKLWVPDCYFLNSKEAFVHDMTVQNRVFQLHPDGTVHYGIRLTTTAACVMNLEKFPLDKQTCNLEVESYGYTVDDIELYWEGNENAVQGTEKLDIPQFSFLGKNVLSKEVFLYTGSYVRLIVRFLIQREVTSYLFQIYWPMILVTIASWISFWMNYESSAARVTVGLSSMLVLNTINSHLREKLPNVSCVKAIDVYMMVCFLFIFLSLVEYVYINFFFYARRGRRLGRHARRRQRLMRLRQRLRRQAQRLMAGYQYEEVLMQLLARWWHREAMTEEEAYDGQPPIEQEEERPCPPPSPAVLVHARPDSGGFLPLPDVCSVGDHIHFEDEVTPAPPEPVQASLASPEHCSSLSSFSLRAPLAQAESFSSLSSLSSDETLSDLPCTSEQDLQDSGSSGEGSDGEGSYGESSEGEGSYGEGSEDREGSDEGEGSDDGEGSEDREGSDEGEGSDDREGSEEDALEVEDEIAPIDSCDSSDYEDFECFEGHEDREDNEGLEGPSYPDANSTSDESEGSDVRMVLLSRRRVRGGNTTNEEVFELCESLERIHRLPEDVRMESGYLGLREECRRAVAAAAHRNEDIDGADADDEDEDDEDDGQDEQESADSEHCDHDSSSDSEDSSPPSPKCSFKEGFSSKLFRPVYIPLLDRCSRVLFPLAFLVFNIIYWVYHVY